MAKPKWKEREALSEKLGAYLKSHRRVVEDFERSLANARHYVNLAEVAKDKEPAQAIAMLEQIKEIDLPGHLQTQVDAFEEVSALLGGGEAEKDEEEGGQAEFSDLIESVRERYTLLQEEAEAQQKDIEDLLLYLTKMA